MTIHNARITTPVGPIVFFVKDGALIALSFGDRRAEADLYLERCFGSAPVVEAEDPAGIASRLMAYFDGDFTAIDTIPVDPAGTPFQRQVWAELRKIPAGTTASYAEIARRVGRPRAVRAVGTANGENPVAIVIPCHRVIGSDGRLHGYGGGLHRKEWLLAHEAHVKTALV